MKKYLMLLLTGTCGLIWAQTNVPVPATAPAKPEQKAEIRSEHGYFDGNSREMVYEGKVVITYPKLKLTCERLTISIPANNEHPTNAVAETNVVIEMLDEKGQTNFVTSDKARSARLLPHVATGHPLTDPLTLIVSFYGFVEAFARHRGLDPDVPRNLRKVTETV